MPDAHRRQLGLTYQVNEWLPDAFYDLCCQPQSLGKNTRDCLTEEHLTRINKCRSELQERAGRDLLISCHFDCVPCLKYALSQARAIAQGNASMRDILDKDLSSTNVVCASCVSAIDQVRESLKQFIVDEIVAMLGVSPSATSVNPSRLDKPPITVPDLMRLSTETADANNLNVRTEIPSPAHFLDSYTENFTRAASKFSDAVADTRNILDTLRMQSSARVQSVEPRPSSFSLVSSPPDSPSQLTLNRAPPTRDSEVYLHEDTLQINNTSQASPINYPQPIRLVSPTSLSEDGFSLL